MTECDIIRGIEIYSDPSYIFSVGKDLNPKDLRPWLLQLSPDTMLSLQQVGGLRRHSLTCLIVSRITQNYSTDFRRCGGNRATWVLEETDRLWRQSESQCCGLALKSGYDYG